MIENQPTLEHSEPTPEMPELENLRAEIDVVDTAIIQDLARRMDIALKIKQIKQETGMATFDPGREEKLKARIKELAKDNNLSEDFCLQLYGLILAESKRVQDNL